MDKNRMEAFSDGVIAIIITIMVLELRPPHGATPADLRPLIPTFLSYVLSYIYVGIYWNNHHHLIKAIDHVNGRILWSNLHLLFWLSLVPFSTAWMGENHLAPWPVALYGVNLLGAAAAYTILTRALICLHGIDSRLAAAMGSDLKGKLSLLGYLVALPLAFVNTWLACACYVAVATVWLVPDTRIEKSLHP